MKKVWVAAPRGVMRIEGSIAFTAEYFHNCPAYPRHLLSNDSVLQMGQREALKIIALGDCKHPCWQKAQFFVEDVPPDLKQYASQSSHALGKNN